MEYEYQHTTPEERTARRAEREKARQARQRARRRGFFLRIALPLLILLSAVLLTAAVRGGQQDPQAPEADEVLLTAAAEPELPAEPEKSETPAPFSPVLTEETETLGEELGSEYAVVLDLNAGTILAQKSADAVINPASMTKILTVLVAAEQVTDLEDTFTVPVEITDYSFRHGCSAVGFEVGETVTVRDLFYGTVLPSGADAALGLAYYVAGSQEAFVELMNDKLAELGLSETAHFTNCVGIYDAEHHCTVTDMALILKAALENDLCRQVLSAHTYTTAPTAEHPEGLQLSNWFLRRIEDKVGDGVEVLSGKTGYVVQSGSCAASYGRSGGRELICVTGQAGGSWPCIYDHAALYQRFGGNAS
jgi:D-alanyl-D-alanine carboxypeptidase (penicillin-binding protein 5/6)